METLKYTVIKSRAQYNKYCNMLEQLVSGKKNKASNNEIELLTFLIEKWDEEHNSLMELDPIELLIHLMAENNLRSRDLVTILGISKGMVSCILNYEKGLSKESIRKLAQHFKVSQEAFNRPYNKHSEAA